MIKRWATVAILLLTFFIISLSVFAADELVRFCYNEQDSIIIGKVVGVEEDGLDIQVTDYVTGMNFSLETKLAQRRPERILLSTTYDAGVGDFIAAGISYENNRWFVPYLIMGVDGPNADTLKVLPVSNSDTSFADSEKLTSFFNTRGADPFLQGAQTWEESSYEYSSSFTVEGMRFAVYQPKQTKSLMNTLSDSFALVAAGVLLISFFAFRLIKTIRSNKQKRDG